MKAVCNVFMYFPMWVFVAVLACLIGCSMDKESIPEPDPNPAPDILVPELRPVKLMVKLEQIKEENFFRPLISAWNEQLGLMIASYDKEGRLLYRQLVSHSLPGTDASSAIFNGLVAKKADSLVAYCYFFDIQNINLSKQYQNKNDTSFPSDLLIGSFKIDGDSASVTLKHEVSQLNLNLINQTGRDLVVENVFMNTVDKSRPFRVNWGYSYETTDLISLSLDNIVLKKDTSLIARLSLFLFDEAALDGKAVRYMIKTSSGTYIYTKSGKKFQPGCGYVDNIEIEGK